METAEAIRRLAPGLMISMMSAAFPANSGARLAALGITQMLDKPFPLNRLRALVRPLVEVSPPGDRSDSVGPAPDPA